MSTSNKENQINRPILIDSRQPLSTIINKPSNTTYDQARQQSKNNNNNNNNNRSVLPNSRISQAKQEHSLENALKKIKELESQLKQKDERISQLEIKNQLLIESYSENEKTNSRINNNRIRKIQQLTLENQNLKERLDEVLYKNEKNDKINFIQNNHRIRMIHKLKNENNELKEKKEHDHHHDHHQHQHEHDEHQHQSSTLKKSSEPVQPIIIVQQTPSTINNYYGLEDYEEHVGEC